MKLSKKILSIALAGAIILPMGLMGQATMAATVANTDPKLAYPINDIKACNSAKGYPGYSGRYHGGIDIVCKTGTSLYACEEGTVIASKNLGNQSYGQYIQIKHKDGKSMIYAQLKTRSVKVGQHISKGQYIGLTGNSGNSTSPHLHLEYRTATNKHDKTLDPKTYFYRPEVYSYKCSKDAKGNIVLNLNFKQTLYDTPAKMKIEVVDEKTKSVVNFQNVQLPKGVRSATRIINNNGLKKGRKYRVRFRIYNTRYIDSVLYVTGVIKK